MQGVDDIFGRDVTSRAGRVRAAAESRDGRVNGRDAELRVRNRSWANSRVSEQARVRTETQCNTLATAVP